MRDHLVIAIVLAAVGGGTAALGLAARRGLIDLALGGHTRDTTSADSWKRAHRRIGAWLIAAGAGATGAGLVCALVPDLLGWAAGAGFAWVALVPLIGGAAGVGELRQRNPMA